MCVVTCYSAIVFPRVTEARVGLLFVYPDVIEYGLPSTCHAHVKCHTHCTPMYTQWCHYTALAYSVIWITSYEYLQLFVDGLYLRPCIKNKELCLPFGSHPSTYCATAFCALDFFKKEKLNPNLAFSILAFLGALVYLSGRRTPIVFLIFLLILCFGISH